MLENGQEPFAVDLHDADLDLAIGILREVSRHPASRTTLDVEAAAEAAQVRSLCTPRIGYEGCSTALVLSMEVFARKPGLTSQSESMALSIPRASTQRNRTRGPGGHAIVLAGATFDCPHASAQACRRVAKLRDSPQPEEPPPP